MKNILLILLVVVLVLAVNPAQADPGNPRIDMEAYLKVAQEAALHRAERRISESEFLRRSQGNGVIVLDARSREKFELLHIEGALNLSFPDIDEVSLARLLPDKNATILIYCNNNFEGEKMAFPPKRMEAALNISTYISLYSYGYRNLYELAPLLETAKTQLKLVPGGKS